MLSRTDTLNDDRHRDPVQHPSQEQDDQRRVDELRQQLPGRNQSGQEEQEQRGGEEECRMGPGFCQQYEQHDDYDDDESGDGSSCWFTSCTAIAIVFQGGGGRRDKLARG